MQVESVTAWLTFHNGNAYTSFFPNSNRSGYSHRVIITAFPILLFIYHHAITDDVWHGHE